MAKIDSTAGDGEAAGSAELGATTGAPVYAAVVSKKMRTPDGKFAEVSTIVQMVSQGVVEIMAGVRQPDQLAEWLEDDVYLQLLERANAAKAARLMREERPQRPNLAVLSSRIQCPAPDVVEAVVLLQGPSRVRAVTLRLQRRNRRWRVRSVAVL